MAAVTSGSGRRTNSRSLCEKKPSSRGKYTAQSPANRNSASSFHTVTRSRGIAVSNR